MNQLDHPGDQAVEIVIQAQPFYIGPACLSNIIGFSPINISPVSKASP